MRCVFCLECVLMTLKDKKTNRAVSIEPLEFSICKYKYAICHVFYRIKFMQNSGRDDLQDGNDIGNSAQGPIS